MSIELMLSKKDFDSKPDTHIPDPRLLINDIRKFDYKDPAYQVMSQNRIKQNRCVQVGSSFGLI